jgi:hypothetical protein
MGYLQQFEDELHRMLDMGEEGTDEIIRFVSEKVLESYRNGLKAGKNGEQVIRDGKSRRPYAGSQAQ